MQQQIFSAREEQQIPTYPYISLERCANLTGTIDGRK